MPMLHGELAWREEIMSSKYGIKVRGKLGPDCENIKCIRIPNKFCEWWKGGLVYEADLRNSEIVIGELQLEKAN